MLSGSSSTSKSCIIAPERLLTTYRSLGNDVPGEPEFANALMVLEQFIGTALESGAGEASALHWPPGGPWRRREKGDL